MRRTLAGSRMLITGASSGIGRQVVGQAVKAGAHVTVTARSTEQLEALARSLAGQGPPVTVAPGDLTSPADREQVVGTAVDRMGGLDVLVNNAGVASFGHFAVGTEEVLRQVMEVNFFAPAELMRLAIPHLREGKQPAIVNVASMCGRRGLPAWSEYSASKFALCGLTDALRGEMLRFGIDVLLIVPGLTASDFRKHMLQNVGRMKIDHARGMAPEQVAADILRAIASNRRETVLGREARWILRFNRWMPWLVNWGLARKVRQLYAANN